MNIDGNRRRGGNRTLTLSRHNLPHRGRHALRSSPGCEGRGGEGRLIRGFGGVTVDEVP